jgi:hypothetical protein
VCFELPAEIEQRRSEHKHRFSLADHPGWLAVQSFEPDPAIPTSTEQRTVVVRQRFVDEGWQDITSTAAVLAAQQAIRVDAVLTTHAPPLQRRMWLIPRAGSWVVVDITGPRTEFNRSLATWEPIANRATSQPSH